MIQWYVQRHTHNTLCGDPFLDITPVLHSLSAIWSILRQQHEDESVCEVLELLLICSFESLYTGFSIHISRCLTLPIPQWRFAHCLV